MWTNEEWQTKTSTVSSGAENKDVKDISISIIMMYTVAVDDRIVGVVIAI